MKRWVDCFSQVDSFTICIGEVGKEIRLSGRDFEQVEAVVLQTDGTFSVLESSDHVLEHGWA